MVLYCGIEHLHHKTVVVKKRLQAEKVCSRSSPPYVHCECEVNFLNIICMPTRAEQAANMRRISSKTAIHVIVGITLIDGYSTAILKKNAFERI